MALDPHSENPEAGLPDDYRRDHPDEHPSDWGWHGEWGRAGRIAGWVVATLLMVMITSTWYNFSGPIWLIMIAGVIVAMLARDHWRRRSPWRSHVNRRQPALGLCVFLITVGLVLEFVPLDNTRVTALSIIAEIIMALGALGLALRLTRWR